MNPEIQTIQNEHLETLEADLPCVKTAMNIPLGDLGAGPRPFALGRVDVDDVEVTSINGTTKKVRGTYRIFDADTHEEVLERPLPTNTGIDVPPGTYRVVVEYKTKAGEIGTFDQVVTTP